MMKHHFLGSLSMYPPS